MAPITSPPGGFPVAQGGPLHALLGRAKLERGDRRDVVRVSLALGLATWLPIALCGLVELAARRPIEPILRDLAVHVRLLVAIPLLLIAEQVLGPRCSEVVERLDKGEFLERGALAAIARRARRAVGSTLVEALILAVTVGTGQAMFWDVLGTSGPFAGSRTAAHHGPASVWYQWVAFPVFGFVALRFLFRWLVWGRFLWQVSRQPIRTEPSHPDRCGGLGFLSRPIAGIALAALGTTAIFSGGAVAGLLDGSQHLADLRTNLIAWAVAVLLVAFVPLVPFFGCLLRTRVRGEREYGIFALTYSRNFHSRWITPRTIPDPLGAQDIQALNDLGGAFGVIKQMRVVPFGRNELVMVLGAMAIPLLPLIFTQVPLSRLVKMLLSVAGIR